MKTAEAAMLYRLTQEMADVLDREAPITQMMAFLRIAMSGDTGIDQGRLADDLKLSSAGASRTIQALSTIHYLKDRPGYGLVERVFDPTDNRRRELKLTPKGEKAVDKLVDATRRGR
jgi:DNA-binding MarR family transcriptional regulator